MDNFIFRKLKQIIFGVLEPDVRKEQIIPEAKFRDDLGADSLDAVEIMMAIEEEFDIEIPDEHLVDLATVRQVVDYVSRQLAGKARRLPAVASAADFQI